MKIVQSLWLKPSLKKNQFNYFDRRNGGWIDKKYNYMSWTLSCLQFKKYYNEVELVTDKMGFDLLINKLELPYTKVKICLDDLNDFHPDLWALGKIYAYSLQNSPFIHADGDIFIYDKFDQKLESSGLIAQNIENGYAFYEKVFNAIHRNFDYIPKEIIEFRNKNSKIIAANAGILGGHDTDFIKRYANNAFEFVRLNMSKLSKVDISQFNPVYEQFLFYALATQENKHINFYLEKINHSFDGVAEFMSAPNKGKFIHPIGGYKKRKIIEDLLMHRLQTDYPKYFYKILNLLRTNQI